MADTIIIPADTVIMKVPESAVVTDAAGQRIMTMGDVALAGAAFNLATQAQATAQAANGSANAAGALAASASAQATQAIADAAGALVTANAAGDAAAQAQIDASAASTAASWRADQAPSSNVGEAPVIPGPRA